MNFRSDYKQFLSDAWELHQKPRAPDAPTVISTFAGGGGSSLGYSMAGYNELLAVEMDAHAVATLRTNFPHLDIYHGDIGKLSVAEALERTGLQPGELDLFDGSPPCQGFSTAGKRKLNDERNQLFREYVRLLKGLNPKAFVMENVSGMVKGRMKLLFAEILKELKACGYQVSARLLNTRYFNVPQARPRMIFIGTREDLGIEPTHPKAQNSDISCQTALINVDNQTFAQMADTPKARELREQFSKIPPGKNLQFHTQVANSGFSLIKAHPRKPCNTILKSVSVGSRGAGILHWSENRLLTIEEAKRLGSFPDEYQLSGKFEHQWERIGNSVPPLFMKSIAEHIKKTVFEAIC